MAGNRNVTETRKSDVLTNRALAMCIGFTTDSYVLYQRKRRQEQNGKSTLVLTEVHYITEQYEGFTDVSRIITFPERRFPGQSFSQCDYPANFHKPYEVNV